MRRATSAVIFPTAATARRQMPLLVPIRPRPWHGLQVRLMATSDPPPSSDKKATDHATGGSCVTPGASAAAPNQKTKDCQRPPPAGSDDPDGRSAAPSPSDAGVIAPDVAVAAAAAAAVAAAVAATPQVPYVGRDLPPPSTFSSSNIAAGDGAHHGVGGGAAEGTRASATTTSSAGSSSGQPPLPSEPARRSSSNRNSGAFPRVPTRFTKPATAFGSLVIRRHVFADGTEWLDIGGRDMTACGGSSGTSGAAASTAPSTGDAAKSKLDGTVPASGFRRASDIEGFPSGSGVAPVASPPAAQPAAVLKPAPAHQQPTAIDAAVAAATAAAVAATNSAGAATVKDAAHALAGAAAAAPAAVKVCPEAATAAAAAATASLAAATSPKRTAKNAAASSGATQLSGTAASNTSSAQPLSTAATTVVTASSSESKQSPRSATQQTAAAAAAPVAGVTAGASAAAAATATAALDDLTDEDLSELVCPVFRPDAELADDLRRLLAGLGVPARLARVAQRRVVLPCMLWADAPADSLPAAATAKWPPAPPPPEVASADAAATFDRDRADDVAAPAVRGGFYADDTVATLAPLVAATARNEKLDRGVAAAAPSAAPPIPVGCIVARYFIPRGGAAERLRVIIDTMMSGSTTSARVSRTAQRAIRDAALRWQDWRLHRRLRRAGRATATLQQQQDAADRIKRDGMSQVQNGEVPSDVRNGDAHRLRPYRANAVDPAAAITRLSPDEQQHMRSQHRAVATAAAATRLGRLLGGRDVEDRLVRPHYSQLVDQHPSHGIEDDMGTLRRGVVTADTSEAGTIPLSGTDLRGLDTSTERRRVKKPTTWRGQWRATAAAASRAFAGGGRSQLERHAAASRIGTDTIESTTHRLTFIMLPGRLITIHRVHTPFVRAAMAEFDGRFRDRSPSILVSELIKRCAITFQDGAREEEQLISGLESCFMLRRGEFGAFLVEAHRIGRRAGISRAVLPQLKTTYAETCRLLNLDKTRDVTVRETRSALRTALKLHEDVQETSRSMLMLFFNENAHTLEDLMRVLTVFSTVFIPVTTVAGFFGMPAGWVPWTSEALPPGAAAAATAVTTVVAEVAAAGSSTTADVAIAVASDPAVGLTSPAPPEAPSPVEVTAVAAEDVLTINDQPQEKHGFLKACGVIAAVGFGTLAWVRRRIGRQVI